MKFKAILWDFDGTLVSSAGGITSSMQATLAASGFAVPEEAAIRKTIGLTLEQTFLRLTHPTCSEALLPELVGTYRSLHASHAAPLTHLFEGARTVLERCRQAGILSIVVSNKGRKGLDQLVQQFDLQDLIPVRLSAEEVPYRKPDARLYACSLEPLLRGIARQEVLVVGDTEADLGFAQGAGLTACWARYGYGDPLLCTSLRPAYLLDSLAHMIDLIEQDWQ